MNEKSMGAGIVGQDKPSQLMQKQFLNAIDKMHEIKETLSGSLERIAGKEPERPSEVMRQDEPIFEDIHGESFLMNVRMNLKDIHQILDDTNYIVQRLNRLV